MAFSGPLPWLILLISTANAADVFHDWRVAFQPVPDSGAGNQPVITINGEFPGPLINATTNDFVHINVHNDMDEPLLFTWNGIEMRLNSWQDGVLGTNCPIPPGKSWTYVFEVKDQIGTFFYFPSINFQKAGGGFGPIRVNNRVVITIPFAVPEAEFELLIGDWSYRNYKDIRASIDSASVPPDTLVPDTMLINGKASFPRPNYESLSVTQGKTYRLRISNVGSAWSFNFRIQNHTFVLIEAEGSYTNQITMDSLDIHVGQSYSILVTANQDAKDYYIIASPKLVNATQVVNATAIGVLHYDNSTSPATGPVPPGPDPSDLKFSLNQAKSIEWNLTSGAARPNPQGSFNVTKANITHTYMFRASSVDINGIVRYLVNNVSYIAPETPLKLADTLANDSSVFQLDQFPTNSSLAEAVDGVFVATGIHKAWVEIVIKNDLLVIDSWHLDGFSFFVVGFGNGEWGPDSRQSYNLNNPLSRSTTQVYPGGWTAVYLYLDNPGMWNLRSQLLENWYLGEELYVRVYDPDTSDVKEKDAPENVLHCGIFESLAPAPAPEPSEAESPAISSPTFAPVSAPPAVVAASDATFRKTSWLCVVLISIVVIFSISGWR